MRLACFVLFVCAPAWADGPEDAVVKVNRTKFLGDRHADSKTQGGWGTGTVVKADAAGSLVLTNKHVAPDSDAFYFVLHDGYAYAAEWVKADDRVDLALLRVGRRLPAAPLAAAEPAVGDPLRMWGCLHAGPMTARTGRVTDSTGMKDEKGYGFLRASFRGGHGDSGAGVFDKAGGLAGVVYAGPEEGGESWNMNVRLAEVKKFLDEKAAPAKAIKPANEKVREQPKE